MKDTHVERILMKITRGLIDFSQICYAQFYGSVLKDEDLETNEDKVHYFKHCVLNRLADIQTELKLNEITLALDSSSWRKKEFEFYKASRKTSREKNPAETQLLFSCIDSLTEDIKQMNYKVLKIDEAEADDVIAILANHFSSDPLTEKIYIVSTDKDFQQVTFDKVFLYNHLKHETINCENKDVFLVKLILGGDASDGVPNVLSDDDTFVNSSKRQKPCGDVAIQKILVEGLENRLVNDAQFRKNYERNQKLITLSQQFIPEHIWNRVEEEYETITREFKRKNAIQIGNFFRTKNLNGLMSKINLFA